MITPVQAAALRYESAERWRVPILLRYAREATGPEELAGLLHLALLQAGLSPHATYDQVCGVLATAGTVGVEFTTEAALAAAAKS